MNKACLVGRLTKDPQISQVTQDRTRAHFTLAVDGIKNAKGERQADFIPVTAWGKTAEVLGKYGTKGRQIALSGRLRTWSWSEEGKTRYEMEVVAENVEFLGSKEGNRGSTSMAQPATPIARAEEEEGDELPF